MAEKISTLILKVDLDCHVCYKKIRKILCKYQDEEKMRTISYDDKSKTITISGPFDPHKLSCKLRCKAGKVIKAIDIKDNTSKPAEKEKPTPPPEKEKPKEKPAPPAEKEKPKPPAETEKEKPKEKPAEADAPAAFMEIPSWPAAPYAPCRCAGYHGGWRCCDCARQAGGWAGGPPPQPAYPACYDAYRGCRFFSEDDPSASCSIM